MPTLLTLEQARATLDRHGTSIADFCRKHQLNNNLVSDLLNGRKKGKRGEAHRAAVLLGIKDGVIEGQARRSSSSCCAARYQRRRDR